MVATGAARAGAKADSRAMAASRWQAIEKRAATSSKEPTAPAAELLKLPANDEEIGAVDAALGGAWDTRERETGRESISPKLRFASEFIGAIGTIENVMQSPLDTEDVIVLAV